MIINKIVNVLDWMVNNSRNLSRIMLAIMAALVIANFIFPAGYDRFFWESLPGAGAIYGFFSCMVIVFVSKFLGTKLLYRPENYYENENKPNQLIGSPTDRENRDD